MVPFFCGREGFVLSNPFSPDFKEVVITEEQNEIKTEITEKIDVKIKIERAG